MGKLHILLVTFVRDTIVAGRPRKNLRWEEVMLKVITFADTTSRTQVNSLIEEVSKSTNRQTPVEADRRSNDAIQMQLQKTFLRISGISTSGKRASSTTD